MPRSRRAEGHVTPYTHQSIASVATIGAKEDSKEGNYNANR